MRKLKIPSSSYHASGKLAAITEVGVDGGRHQPPLVLAKTEAYDAAGNLTSRRMQGVEAAAAS